MAVAEFRGRVMASELVVLAVSGTTERDTAHLDDAIRDVVSFVEHLERCWSRFLADSDVSRINRLVDGGILSVDPSTITLLATMIEGHQATAGRFDPTVLRALVDNGYAASRLDPSLVTSVAPVGRIRATLHDLELDPVANTVTVPPGLALDPGGIGKGLAADLAVLALRDAGVDGALVGIGGDLAMSGMAMDAAGWRVDVEHPHSSAGLLCPLVVSGGGVATSSTHSRRWIHDGVERHHQIDPTTSECSSTDLASVTVVASAGWAAEVHATAALAVGGERFVSYLEGHGLSGVAVVLDGDTEHVITTHDLDGLEVPLRTAAS